MNFPTYMLVNMTFICETMDMLFAFRLGDCLTELYVWTKVMEKRKRMLNRRKSIFIDLLVYIICP